MMWLLWLLLSCTWQTNSTQFKRILVSSRPFVVGPLSDKALPKVYKTILVLASAALFVVSLSVHFFPFWPQSPCESSFNQSFICSCVVSLSFSCPSIGLPFKIAWKYCTMGSSPNLTLPRVANTTRRGIAPSIGTQGARVSEEALTL